MSTNNNIRISEIATRVQVNVWENEPGFYISRETHNSLLTQRTATGIFNAVVNNKIPEAKKIIHKLAGIYCLQNCHYPLPLKTTFFIFIDELIEHYQNQLEQKDEKLDQDYINLKRSLANNFAQIWPKDNHEIHEFLNELKNKLALVNAVPDKFDATIALWSEVLHIQYVANMTLMALFLPNNYVPIHRMPRSDSDLPLEKRYHSLFIPYSDSIESASLILSQISKDISWIIPLMLEKLPALDNPKLEEDFFRFTVLEEELEELNKAKKQLPSVSSLVEKYTRELKSIANQFSYLDFSDNKQISQLHKKTYLAEKIVCRKSLDYGSVLQKLEENKNRTFTNNEITISKNKDEKLLQLISNYSDCAKIKDNYIHSPLCSAFLILSGIADANDSWLAFKNQGEVPDLGPFFSINYTTEKDSNHYAEKLLTELYEDTPKKSPLKGKDKQSINSTKHKDKEANNSGAKSGQKGPALSANPSKKKANASLAPTKTTNTTTLRTTKATTTVQTTTTNTITTTSTTATTTTTMTAIAPLTPRRIELLREKLVALFEANPTSSLRQVIWHLDHLMVIQDTLANSALSKSEHLCLLSTVSNFAQKALEQAYRFCLKREQASFRTTHNLKTYHRKWAPSTTYPAVVMDLFLANNWQRYFYSQHKKWSSITTFQVEIPRVLGQLHKIAEGEGYSIPALNLTVEEIIKNTCEHVETLLLKQSNAVESTSQKQSPESRKLEKVFSEKMFSNVYQTLEKFLPQFNAGHPFTLKAKQALATLKMLEVSLQQMNKVQNVRQFSTWTVWGLQQLQESMENVLHCIEYYQKNGQMSIQHELKTLAEELGLKMGSLAEDTHQLSYKVRYPSENKNDSLSAQIIDDLEAIKEFPDFEKGFKFQNTPRMVWEAPSLDVSLNSIAGKINSLLIDTEQFMRDKALPALQKARDNYIASLAS